MKRGERVSGYGLRPLFSGKDRRLEDYISKLSVRKNNVIFISSGNKFLSLVVN